MPQNDPSRRPWERLEPEVARVLRPGLPALVDDVIAAVREAVPPYRRSLEGSFGRNVRVGVEQALGGFLELIESRDEARLPGREVYIALGRGELREGRSLDALLTAYRAGAQISWRRLAAAGDAAGLDPPVLYTLAEAIFAYIDELSAASAEGYAQEQSATAGERGARRRRLIELLCREPAAPPTDVEAAADQAAWPLPNSVAALAFESERAERIAARLPPDVLVAAAEPTTWALVPDSGAPGRRAELERALGGAAAAALGPAVAWAEAARSARRADLALSVARARGGAELLVADEHMLDLLLARDEGLTEDLVRTRLAPLRELGPGPRRRLTETLRAWLDHAGEVRLVAEALHVHPQSVRYRVAQLRELFGPALDEPALRLELALAMRAAGRGEP
jgi:hypothetical protein